MSARTDRLHRTGFRPSLEPLEDRAVPALGFDPGIAIGGPGQDLVYDLATDAAGNRYVTGSFKSYFSDGSITGIDFNPDPAGETLLYGDPRSISPFVAKYDPNGTLVWAWGGSATNYSTGQGHSIAVDSHGNVYATGHWGGRADFNPLNTDPDAPSVLSTVDESNDSYVLKLNADGSFAWVRRLGGPGQDLAGGVAVDPSGNVYAGTAQTGFLAKFDSAGDQIWSHQFKANITAVAVDAGGGNVLATGGFSGKNVDFDPGPGTYPLSSSGRSVDMCWNAFVLKLTSAGTFVWARSFNNTGTWGGSGGNDIVVDAAGSVYTSVSASGTVDFNPGKAAYRLSGEVLSKLDSRGTFVWAKVIGGTGTDLAVDASNNVYVAGGFGGTVDFNPGAGTYLMTATSGSDGFVTKLTSQGDFVRAAQVGSTINVSCRGVAVSGGKVLLTGTFTGTALFPDQVLAGYGGEDFFVIALNQ